VLAELFEYKADGAADAEEFAMLKEGQYIVEDPDKSDTEIDVPVVPEGCEHDTKLAAAALQSF